LLALLATASTSYAQTCTGSPVAVQVLGSGAPGFVKDRSNELEFARRLPARRLG
jgi:hypothetical protein